MKIIHLIDALGPGGKERQIVETLKYLSGKKDITCELVIMSHVIHYEHIEQLNIKTHKIIRKWKKDPTVFFKLLTLFKETKPDIIHSWNSMCSIYAIPAAKILQIKFINHFLRDAPLRLKPKDQVWIRSILTFPFSDRIAANSKAGLEAYRVPKNKRACLYNGFDFSRIQGLASKKAIREELAIHTRHVVGMVAAFSANKDYATFFNAAQSQLRKRDDITFIAVGGGNLYERMIKLIKPEFRGKIILTGQRKRVLNIINLFDIGILTTNLSVHGEGTPNAIMEYMALKKPVIATDCLGNRELVENGRTGFLVKANDPCQIEEKISMLLNNPGLSLQLGQNGFEKLKTEYDLKKSGNEFIKLYRDLSK